jgi:uncharacterized membrane protein YdbT with pleckstrin-like domain
VSSNAPPNTAPNTPATDLWKTKRTHRVIRRFKRGPDGNLRFGSQEKDEVVRRVVREHPIFFLRTAVPLFGALILFGLVIWGNTSSPQLGALWGPLEVLTALIVVGAGLYSAYRIFELWWVNVDVITSQRILTWKGLLHPTRQETKLEKVSQVAVTQPSLLAVLLNYGNVKVYLVGGKDLDILKVSKPKVVRDEIEGVRQSYQKELEAKKEKEKPPHVEDKVLAPVLAELAKPKPPPTFEDADKKWEHRRDPRKPRGPLRTFGGPLHIPCDVHYESEEYTVEYIQRSKIVLVYELAIPVAILLLLLAGAVTTRSYYLWFAIGFFLVGIFIVLTIINYVDDVFILTNKRIVDIDRHFIFLFEEHETAPYDKIAKVDVIIPNVFELMLDVGNIVIETQGSNPDIKMRRVPQPFRLQDKILELQENKTKFEKTKAENDRKGELNMWFSKVLVAMEPRIHTQSVPDLYALDLWEAIDKAGKVGIRVVPDGISARYPHIAPGKIVSQSPPPGTMVELGGEKPQSWPQVHVILSK